MKRWKQIGPDFYANTEYYVFMLRRYSGKYKLFMRTKNQDKQFTDLDVEFAVTDNEHPNFNDVNEFISTAYPESCIIFDHSQGSIIDVIGITNEEGEELVKNIGQALMEIEKPSEFLEQVVLKCNANPVKIAFVFYTLSRIMHESVQEMTSEIKDTKQQCDKPSYEYYI